MVDPPPSMPDIDSFPTALEPLWIVPINPDTLRDNSPYMGIVNDQLITQSERVSPYLRVRMLDPESGLLLHEDNYPINISTFTSGPHVIDSRHFILHANTATFVYDGEQGQLETYYESPEFGEDNSWVFEDRFFIIHQFGPTPSGNPRMAELVEISPLTGNIARKYLAKDRETYEGYHPTFGCLAFNPEEQVFYAQVHGLNNMNQARLDVHAFSLTSGSEIWSVTKIAKGAGFVKGDMAYANGRVFLQTGTEVICLNHTDGNELWRKRIDQISQTCNLLVVNDLLIVNTDDQNLYALETSTGNTRWKIGDDEQSFRNPSNMVVHDGKIYFTSESKFNCIQANNGQVILNDFSPAAQMMQNSFLGFRTLPVIDETRSQIIINDNFFVMGLPIP